MLRVLHVASELAPFAQSGGLADVLAGLPAAQAELGADAAVIVPLYRSAAATLEALELPTLNQWQLPVTLGGWSIDTTIKVTAIGRVRIVFVDCPPLFDRDGIYGPTGNSEWGDNHIRFGVLGKAATEIGPHLFGATPDVLHVHDWQAGPAAAFARANHLPSLLVATIHNLAYRGIFPKSAMTDLGLPWSLFTYRELEFYDQVCFLKGACGLADAVTTVSPSYAREILTPERGEALDGFLRNDVATLVGIVNGIDSSLWDPATDPAIAANYMRGAVAGKQACRAALAREVGLPIENSDALIGVIARMTGQKGLDLIAEVVPQLADLGARLVVLGAGEPDYEARFRYLAATFDRHVSTTIGFDVAFARRIYAGSDLFVMPSRFEPCGLGQLYAMRYGAVPIVHAVGGLRDTVEDGRTGIHFANATPEDLASALGRAVALFRDRPSFVRVQDAAMARDSSWKASASEYLALYRNLRARHKRP